MIFFRNSNKSCYRDLNSGPLPYQGSALPLSYNSNFSRAENGTQTRDPQLGRLVLYQLSYFRIAWAKMDSNHRRRKPADLQSAPFGHSGICPFRRRATFAAPANHHETAAKVGLFFYFQNFSAKKSLSACLFLILFELS